MFPFKHIHVRRSSRAWWHRSGHHLSLWPAPNEMNCADWFNLQYAATPAMWDESMQGTEPQWYGSTGSMSKLKSHTAMNWIFTLKIFIDMHFNLLRTKLLRSTARWCRDHAVNGWSTDWWPNRTPAAALHSKKKTNSVATHQSLLSASQIMLLHIIFHNDKSSEQRSTVWNGGWNSWIELL